MLEPTIPDRGHICTQFCRIEDNFPNFADNLDIKYMAIILVYWDQRSRVSAELQLRTTYYIGAINNQTNCIFLKINN